MTIFRALQLSPTPQGAVFPVLEQPLTVQKRVKPELHGDRGAAPTGTSENRAFPDVGAPVAIFS